MKIGELAQRAGCEVQTVRYYEREGLLDQVSRDASGYRRYDAQALERMRFLRHCRSLDMSLAEMRQLLAFAAQPDPSCGEVNALLDRHIALVQERLSALQALEAQLITLRRSCDGDVSHPCAILQAFQAAARDEACVCHAR